MTTRPTSWCTSSSVDISGYASWIMTERRSFVDGWVLQRELAVAIAIGSCQYPVTRLQGLHYRPFGLWRTGPITGYVQQLYIKNRLCLTFKQRLSRYVFIWWGRQHWFLDKQTILVYYRRPQFRGPVVSGLTIPIPGAGTLVITLMASFTYTYKLLFVFNYKDMKRDMCDVLGVCHFESSTIFVCYRIECTYVALNANTGAAFFTRSPESKHTFGVEFRL